VDNRWFAVDWGRCIGAGGEGEVFLGRCMETWEPCAIKVSTRLDREAAAQQLRIELERCSQAAGEGVVGLIGWNLDVERPFVAFELAKAGSLADEMFAVHEKRCVYHPVQALQRVRAVLVALSNVHARGLIHRDVKPANLLRFGTTVKLTDFGTGRTRGRVWRGDTQAFVGTRMYAAPEQQRGEPVDERADLYAVGCILYEMLTGEMPHSSGQRYHDALVLPKLERFVSSLLDPNPARRPADAQQAIERLDRVAVIYASARKAWERLQLGPSPY
jgi:serine/threonine-protein kinase